MTLVMETCERAYRISEGDYMNAIFAYVQTLLKNLSAFNPLDDYLYPFLLDRFGHATARRVCSALAVVLLLTVLPPFLLAIWVYNCVMDFLLNLGYGWVANLREHLNGIITGGITGDEDEA